MSNFSIIETGDDRPSKRVLLVATTTGYQTEAFLEAAARAEIELQLAKDRCHMLDDPWGDRAIALRFEDPLGAAESLVEAAGQIDGIVAVGDRPAYVAALAAERMGLPFHPSRAVAACGNKFLARECFRKAGLPAPSSFLLALEEDPNGVVRQVSFPCVLKPLGLSASRGVIRANDASEFTPAFRRIRALLESPDILRVHRSEDRFVQVEAFIPGREFALEGIVTEGRLRVLALFDKPDPLDGPYFEETIYVAPSRATAAVQQEILETTSCAVQALGLWHGPVHAEMRVNARGVWMLEVAARPIGGLCAKALPGLEELILRHALGEAVGNIYARGLATGVMMIPIPRQGIYNDVTGEEEARAVPGIDEVIVTAKQGQKLLHLPEGNSYLGFLFASGPTPQTVEAALRNAHDKLHFEIATALPVI